MKRRIIRKNKSQKKILIVGSISLLLFLCVGYAAFQTNLSLTAKGNIKQRKAGEMLRELCNTKVGDGLYEDTYEEGKCTYNGSKPNNYIIFNNEIWRIISISSDNTLKIMKNEKIINKEWDSSNFNDWNMPSTLNTYLNSEYLSSIITNQNKIVAHTWSVGAVTTNNTNLAEQISNENSIQSQQNDIGLITLSEYLRANDNMEQCETFKSNNINSKTCLKTNWMYNITNSYSYLWTISIPTTNYGTDVAFAITGLATPNYITQIIVNKTSAYEGDMIVVPVLYLSSDTILSGSGTEQDPYTITN